MQAKLTSPEIILGRIPAGKRFIERGIAERDRLHCKRFLDGSEAASLLLLDDEHDGEGILPHSQEVGNTNYLAINIQTKIASVAIADPDFHVVCEEQNVPTDPMRSDPALDPTAGMLPPAPPPVTNSEVVRKSLRELWKKRRWARTCRKALLKRSIAGMGCVAYLWESAEGARQGPVLEHVPTKDLSVDPHTTDWRDLTWAARRVRIPRDIAEKRWPARVDFANDVNPIPDIDSDRPLAKDRVEVYVYWDAHTEAIVHGGEILERHLNPYGKVPLIFLEGDIAPESEFSLGDYDLATQLQMMLARLQAIINNQAENGGAILWTNKALLSDASKDAFAKGRPNGPVDVQGDAQDAFGYITCEPMNAALLEAFRLAFSGLDSATGVTEYMRGVIQNDPKFATQVASLQAQSGRRGEQARIEYELFMDDCAGAIIELMQKFGPSLLDETDEADMLLFEAFASVQEVSVLEASTAYKDPAYEMQTSLQLLQALMPFVQAGMMPAEPLIQDLLRAFGKRDVQKYLPPQASQMMSPAGIPAPGGGNAGGASESGRPGDNPPAPH